MRRSPIRSSIGKTRRVAGCSGSRCSGRGLAIRTTTAQENRISFAQPRGLTKGYFCPHLMHQTACSLSRLGLSRASRRLAPHRHAPTGVEHFWQNRTFVASKHLRCTNVPRALIQKVGPEYIHHIPYLESRSSATGEARAEHGQIRAYMSRFQRDEEQAAELVTQGAGPG